MNPISLSLRVNSHQFTVTLVSPPPLLFRGAGEGEGRKCFKADLRHRTILLQYFILMLFNYLLFVC